AAHDCCDRELPPGLAPAARRAPPAPPAPRPRPRAPPPRPPPRPATQELDELAPLHSITSSERACNVAGISKPSAFAVLRLITSSNVVGCSTGRSAGFAPLRMRPV